MSARSVNQTERAPAGYFDDLHQQERLLYHAAQWLGTPFVPHARIRGAGVDCVNLVAQIYLACGFLKDFRQPDYTVQEGKHLEHSKLVAWLESSGHFMRLSILDPKLSTAGDALCFRFRQRVAHHVGLKLYDDKFIHVLEHRRVQVGSLNDRTYGSSLTAIYRPLLMAITTEH
jgi:cell wall-associated NlpC family hydrolase